MAPAEARATGSQPMNEFEAERARIIARNRQKLEEMGVVEAATSLNSMVLPQCRVKCCSKKRTRPQEAAVHDVPLRTSRRLQKMAVEGTSAGEGRYSTASSSVPAQQSSMAATPSAKSKSAAFELIHNIEYHTPFTLMSIGVTVWNLGQLHRGPWQQNFWSSRGCKYHHAYPIGYLASKVAFNRTWKMTITAAESGPVFTVRDESGHFTFSGNSPTKPWTDVCLAHRTGQRISGPQYYGFSDVLLQRAIAAMYTPHELESAQHGIPLCITAHMQHSTEAATTGSEQQRQQHRSAMHKLNAAEQFAQDLERSVRGIGATTSAVIATTTALGGVRHSTLASLQAWLKDDTHVDKFRDFLLNSPEMPKGSRHLPSWRNRWVPFIIQQLTGSACH